MSLQKDSITINFQFGVETKTDPNQLPIGKFVTLQNSIFDTLGRLTKRNGFGQLATLPDTTSKFVTTFNNNLTAVGTDLKAYSQGNKLWVNKGSIYPLQLSTLPLVRSSTNQTYSDIAIASNGLICTTYTDNVSLSGSTTSVVYKYAVADSVTGQNIVAPTTITSTLGTITYSPRVFSLGNNFVLVFGVFLNPSYHLQYLTINQSIPTTISSASDVSTSYLPFQAQTPASYPSFDGVVVNNSLYLSWNGASNTGIRMTSYSSSLSKSAEVVVASNSAAIISVTADQTTATPTIWTSWYGTSASGYTLAVNQGLSTLFSAKQFFSSSSGTLVNIASTAQGGSLNLYYEISNSYSYDNAILTDYINTLTVSNVGSLSATSTLIRSLGLVSKGFILSSTSYFLGSYSSPYQPTYFLINQSGQAVLKLSYQNGGGYASTGLGSVVVTGSSTAQFSYLTKDLIQAVNKGTNVGAGVQVNGIFSQTGVNLATVNFGTSNLAVVETASNLHFNGGFLWSYDGFKPVEHNFFLYPDNIEATWNNTGGSVAAKPDGSTNSSAYFIQSTYEWSDNQGNTFRSAPSIPISVTTTGTTTTGSINVNIPTLRLTYKTANPPKIVLYRWSVGQQAYYQTTSISHPVLNSTSSDSVLITDISSDAQILGNNLLYTTGGVVEDIGAPAATGMTIFDSRLNLIDAEDQNLLWYGKQVVEATPVEMSDLFTNYVAPTESAQGSTGPIRNIFPMDDKLILFKTNALYYQNGTGPDNTGNNSQYSQPIFITGTVGCSNLDSIVLLPTGIMFQADDKGIWLLGRDLSTKYIGKPVEQFNKIQVVSASIVPSTNQVRLMLSSGTTLLYDYFVDQWGEFTGIPGISSTIYNNLYTFINAQGQLFQETPGQYLDGASPTLMSFKTGWISPSGMQGWARLYKIILLGEFLSPHRLTVGIAYDYDPAIVQLASIIPDNYTGTWGSSSSWGSISRWGGNSTREQWEIGVISTTCQSFQISFNEYYDPTAGPSAGAGLTLSGMNLVVGRKKTYARNIPARNSTS